MSNAYAAFDMRIHHFSMEGFTLVTMAKPDGSCGLGVSVCSHDDQFCRATGRRIAAGRAVDAALGGEGPLQVYGSAEDLIEMLREMRESSVDPVMVLRKYTGIRLGIS